MLKRIINYLKSNKVDCFTLSHSTRDLAFTLAETLIVMGIIGVVAALTLPNLNSSTGDKEKVAKVKKIYQNLEDAIGRAQAVYGPVNEWFINDNDDNSRTKRFAERLTEFLKLSKNCANNTSGGCMQTGQYNNILGNFYRNIPNPNGAYSYILADGTSLSIKFNTITNGELSLDLYVDIDGPNKGPFKFNVDVFLFNTDTDNHSISLNRPQDIKHCIGSGGISSCTVWIIEQGNMDYLKIDSDGKCPDGKTILDWTTNTSCK